MTSTPQFMPMEGIFMLTDFCQNLNPGGSNPAGVGLLQTSHRGGGRREEIVAPITWEQLLEAAETLKEFEHTGCDRKSIPDIADALGRSLQSFIEDTLTEPQHFLKHHGSEFYRLLAKKPDEMEAAA